MIRAGMFACILLALMSSVVPAQTVPQPLTSQDTARLETFLKIWSYAKVPEMDKTTRYMASKVMLKDGTVPFVLVYVEGYDWCGSGGCSLLILHELEDHLSILTVTTVTRPPVRVLSHATNGWHDIAVGVGGGGILHAYEVALKFNGRKYPANPTLQHRSPRRAAGVTVFASDNAPTVQLYR